MNFFKKAFLLTAFCAAGTAGVFAAEETTTPHQQYLAQLNLLREKKIEPAKAIADTGNALGQRAAIAYLLESKPSDAGALLEKELPAAKGQTAVEIMGALTELKQTSALPAIREKLKNDSDYGVKTEALLCLGQIGTPADVALLAEYAGKDEYKDTGEQALFCINGPGTADAFSKIIADAGADKNQRKQFIGIASRRPMRQAVPALIANLKDPDESIRNESLKAISRLAADENLAELKKAKGEISDKKFAERIEAAIKKLEK